MGDAPYGRAGYYRDRVAEPIDDAEMVKAEGGDATGRPGSRRMHRLGWPRPRQLVRPLVILAVSLVVGWIIVQLVGAVDWAAVGQALSHLNVVEIPVLVLVLLLRQSLNAVPLTQFLPGLSWWRSLQNDLTALLVGTVAPPPADVVLRVSMFRSWGFDPVDGMAGVTLNTLAFYSVRFLSPALGLIVLSVHGFETGQLVTATLSGLVAVGILIGLLLVVRGDGLASLVGRVAGRVVKRFRATVDPDSWAASVVAFRGRMAGNVRAGLGRSMVALVAMVLADGTVLLLSLRFVGLGASDLTADQVIGLFLLAYPLTLLPVSGLGVLDALLVAGFTELCGIELEPEIVAGLVVWRTVTILGPLLLGAGTLGWWRHHHPSSTRPAG
jgi:putative heme transporter